MSGGPFFFGKEPTGLDAVVFGALATTLLTPIESPIRDFLRSQPACVAYAQRMNSRFFPEFAGVSSQECATRGEAESHSVHMAHG
jgi:glutathione S-transferase